MFGSIEMKRNLLAAALLALTGTAALADEPSYPVYWIGGNDPRSQTVQADRPLAYGVGNSAYVLQQGERNYTVNDQHGAYNKSQDIQFGKDNINGTYQAGIGNAELTYQFGVANLAMTQQQGYGNFAQHVQIGEYNRSLIDQRGKTNVAANFQSGWDGKITYHGGVPVYGPNMDFRPNHYYGAFNDITYRNYPPARLPGGAVRQ